MMKQCIKCYGTSPIDATFCIDCGNILVEANTDKTIHLTPELLYFIYKDDLNVILKDTSTYLKETTEGYALYYHGRKVVFMD